MKGDIRAAHIVVNGLVTVRCYAPAVTLLEQGRIEGDVFTDEFAIERGGVFIGQSCLPPAQAKGKDEPKGKEELKGKAEAKGRPENKPAADAPDGRPAQEVAG
ncbi:bactofilin family protein [Citrobacter koseri]|uniref:bactofilin family protein n=1 Tax=Citrobacter koseri TaxID=545 RepID=UPI000E012052|nr:polymer-forming cytoskeletal protein [Citrobacter koseri]STB73285.1 Polymer-forming cytoskeletal [Citrobacter koseri]STT23465.1 Polymer-forming cytoskeletal [Citrobacter koseri]